LLTLNFVISRLLNQKARQGIPATDSPSVAMAATRVKTPLEKITCFKCQKKGHYQSHCPDADPVAVFAISENLAF